MPCTTILVGKKASYDGSTIISRNDDGGYDTKQVLVVTPDKMKSKYKSSIAHLTIELPKNPLAFTMVPNVDRANGMWATNGINSKNVGMTASETISSNPRVLAADPYIEYQPKKGKKGKEVPGGIGEEDLTYIVLPYIKSAREGVVRLGALLEQYGTYEPNGIAFNDKDEIWWMETIGGHHWIARRVPDDRVVIMPNQFGLDNFDFADAYGAQKEHMCSKDLKEFVEKNHLDLGFGKKFNPRLAFGSHDDGDHIYNTPRAWLMGRYFLPRTYKWDGENADFTPTSDDIPWSFVPEKKVTVEDVRYVLGAHYQGTIYDPYDKRSPYSGKYRSIGIPNTDVCGIMQIRGYMPEALAGVQWFSMGGSIFTACFPMYANVTKMPDYVAKTTKTVDTDYMYWQSRLIGALTDAQYNTALILDERYVDAVAEKGRKLLFEYDEKILALKKKDQKEAYKLCEEANKKICDMVKAESDKALGKILRNASDHMKARYHRNDN